MRAGRSRITVDGNEAAARVAHRLSEVIAIYPITPASPIRELADAWSAAGSCSQAFGRLGREARVSEDLRPVGSLSAACRVAA